MTIQPPQHALTFMVSTTTLAMKHGLKRGIAKAAAKASPPLLVIEAATSVAGAVNSYLKLRQAREHRDGLRRILPYEEERLRLEREKLCKELEEAKTAIDQRREIQKRLGALTLACASAYRMTWDELQKIRTAELPDIEAFDSTLEKLEDEWRQFQHALANYSDSSN